MNKNESKWYKQEAGIIQGCPLSPYLFLFAMTVLFHDLNRGDHLNIIMNIPDNCNFNEVLFAYDTVIVSKDTRTINKYIKELEEAASLFGLKINRGMCLAICMNCNPTRKFRDEAAITKQHEATDLGAKLTKNKYVNRKINEIIRSFMAAWKNLDEYWIHGNTRIKDTIIVFNAIIRSKLMYGLESVQLNNNHISIINTVQIKGLRDILKITTTYVDRTHQRLRHQPSQRTPLPQQQQPQTVTAIWGVLPTIQDQTTRTHT